MKFPGYEAAPDESGWEAIGCRYASGDVTSSARGISGVASVWVWLGRGGRVGRRRGMENRALRMQKGMQAGAILA